MVNIQGIMKIGNILQVKNLKRHLLRIFSGQVIEMEIQTQKHKYQQQQSLQMSFGEVVEI